MKFKYCWQIWEIDNFDCRATCFRMLKLKDKQLTVIRFYFLVTDRDVDYNTLLTSQLE